MTLTLDQFSPFFQAIHGVAPFPWQERLVREVAHSKGCWPTLLDLPTGAGKTAALDIAVFLLALDAERDAAERTIPTRTVLVIDRRTVVDQASQRAELLRRRLGESPHGLLKEVADRLRAISAGGPPLDVAVLRGGIARDDAWARSPVQPLLVVSTVDQVGSRLLFRGYGVSPRMRSVHAGLLGSDTLLLLDEVHLSQPFAETLSALRDRYMSWRHEALPSRWQVVHMSATARAAEHTGRVFRLAEDDRANPTLARRLMARKPVECVEVRVTGGEDERLAQLAGQAASVAKRCLAPGRAVAVVVNRVATARAVRDILASSLDGGVADVVLITGRMRPLDRMDLEHEIGPRIAAGRARDPSARPLVVVATQCIEAGADYDFDALVTECASLDALRQRFGRLNRLGEIDHACGFVIGRSDLRLDTVDPIYGTAMAATWDKLRSAADLDFGITAFELPAPGELGGLLAPCPHAPVLLPAHLDCWCQTSDPPEADPEVALWLHGPDRGEPDVQIVWRADIDEPLLQTAPEEAIARVECCPPSTPESLSLPLTAARRWLQAGRVPDMADVEGALADDGDRSDRRRDPEAPGRPCVLWRGERTTVGTGADLRPGETIVVPASYGGLSRGTWDPDAVTPVRDRGDESQVIARGRATLRMHPAVVADWLPSFEAEPPAPVAAFDEGEESDAERVRDWLETLDGRDDRPEWLRAVTTRALAEASTSRGLRIVRMVPPGSETGGQPVAHLVALLRGRVGFGASSETTEDDTASYTGVPVPLGAHMRGVADRARDFAERCAFPFDLARDVALAAELHDLGKADPRFQSMLHGGSSYRAHAARELLAKSAMPSGDRQAREQARVRAGYPRGGGHELLSAALIEQSEQIRSLSVDPDLLLHLVASHHGACRPLAPYVEDAVPVSVEIDHRDVHLHASTAHGLARLDSGIVDRFWLLNQRYGWYGLAWLEALVRLADHRQSELEQQAGGGLG